MLALSETAFNRARSRQLILPVLLISVILLFFLNIGIGGVAIDLSTIVNVLLGNSQQEMQNAIIWQIRLPRLILAFVVGAGLSICGAAMQAIFRNPLADPGLIGVSSGAVLGAIMVIVLGNSLLAGFVDKFGLYALPLGAFIGCLLICAFIYRLSSGQGQLSVISLLLAGIAVNAMVGSVTGVLTYISDDQALRDMTFWSMGSLAGNSWSLLMPSLCAIIVSIVALLRLAKPLNLYLLGEAQAKHLGVGVDQLKKQVFFFTALCVGASVAICGMIGFVGFIVPHLLRMIIGPDHRYLFPASILFGGSLLALADLIARTIIIPSEVPIGLITSAIGGPFFMAVLLKSYKKLN
ncbi:MAG: iron ABC transporter permease [Gammaproteobacteria bacterium]|nr:iron ABC transporter permease [Gammaproteobacteria bacterium]